jgi:hypothetical protein
VTERNPEPGGHGDEREPTLPADEEAAWAQIVAGYGEQPDDAPDEEQLAEPGREQDTEGSAADGDDARDAGGPEPGDGNADGDVRAAADRPARSFTVYSAGTGPRDWQASDDPEEDHFTPPEPPPLPEADATTKFAWFAALGGPLLLLGSVLFEVYLSWWIVTLGVGGFLGGFATLLTRLREDDEFDDPGGGAVV